MSSHASAGAWARKELSHTGLPGRGFTASALLLVRHTGRVEVLQEIWRRACSVQPAPEPLVIVVLALMALLLVMLRPFWPITRMLVTITHEGAHAVSAMLTGRRLGGIRLHSDTSGLTVSSGRTSGPGMIMTLAAGYVGPAIFGLGAALLLASGRAVGLLWLVVAVLALMLLQIRNWYGVLVLLAAGGVVAALSWFLAPTSQAFLAYLLTWVLLLAAPRPVIELASDRRRGRAAGSDADQLARLTHLPGIVWTGVFLVVNLAAAAVGAAWLLPLREWAADLGMAP